MYTLHDTPNSDIAHVDAMANMSEQFGLFDYVRIDGARTSVKDPKPWVGVIVEANRNISTVGDRLSPVILHGLELMRMNDDVRAVESVQIYKIRLLGIDSGQFLSTAWIRPLPGSLVSKLNAQDTIRLLRLPQVEKQQDGTTNVIGILPNAEDVPLTVNDKIIRHHIMVSGGTGSGKSNVSANLVYQATRMGKCVLIHDAKPDYGLIKGGNTDPDIPEQIWKAAGKHGLQKGGAKDVLKIGFHEKCLSDKVDRVVAFQASDFEPEMLAGFFFPERGDEIQFEGFAAAARRVRANKNGKDYSVDEILERVRSAQGEEAPTSQTRNAILRKVTARKQRDMPWLDVLPKERATGMQSPSLSGLPKVASPFSVDELKARRILVVDYSQMDDAAYALILSYFLRDCHDFCKKDSRGGKKPRKRREFGGVVQLIDEAHRIFDNRSPHSNSLAQNFARIMREGRTLKHSIIMSLQNASLVPGHAMTNLNTRFVMRQNSRHDADAATEKMGKEFALQSLGLGTGDALASVFESESVILARMFPSPYELMRADNPDGVDSHGT